MLSLKEVDIKEKMNEIILKRKKFQEEHKEEERISEESRENISISYFNERKYDEEINYFYNLSNLPKDINKKNFKNAEVKCKKELKIKNKLEYYCKNFEKALENGIGLYLWGNVGTGKTFYSLCIYNELKNKYRVYRTTLNAIYQRIQKSFSNFNSLTEEQVFLDLLKADLIILDDFGKENISETWGKDKLFTIFNFFYEKQKCIVISTTLEGEDIYKFTETKGDNSIIDRFQERIYQLHFSWESRRKEIGEKIFEEFWNLKE